MSPRRPELKVKDYGYEIDILRGSGKGAGLPVCTIMRNEAGLLVYGSKYTRFLRRPKSPEPVTELLPVTFEVVA
jgi:hypothetical protein